jgi:hypothetical protein
MCKENELPAILAYLGFFVEFLQLISFTMDASFPMLFPWNDGTVGMYRVWYQNAVDLIIYVLCRYFNSC